MKNRIRLCSIIALAAIIGFSFIGCGSDNGGISGLNLSGPVFYFDQSQPNTTPQPYTGPVVPIRSLGSAGGSGEIRNGNFSFTIDVPTTTVQLSVGGSFMSARFEITQVSAPVLFYRLTFEEITAPFDKAHWLYWGNDLEGGSYEMVDPMYVSADVTVSGIGRTATFGTNVLRGSDFTLNLKEGWNMVIRTRLPQADGSLTESLRFGEPTSSFTWRLETN